VAANDGSETRSRRAEADAKTIVCRSVRAVSVADDERFIRAAWEWKGGGEALVALRMSRITRR
jgi:hypothetical protein